MLSDPPLSVGEAGLMSLGRFPGSGLCLLTAPSHPSTMIWTVAHLRLSWPSQWRDRTGFAPVSLLPRVGT